MVVARKDDIVLDAPGPIVLDIPANTTTIVDASIGVAVAVQEALEVKILLPLAA